MCVKAYLWSCDYILNIDNMYTIYIIQYFNMYIYTIYKR